jgi:hypothetical protein
MWWMMVAQNRTGTREVMRSGQSPYVFWRARQAFLVYQICDPRKVKVKSKCIYNVVGIYWERKIIWVFMEKNCNQMSGFEPGMIAHIYNSSYSGGKEHSLTTARAKSYWDPISTKKAEYGGICLLFHLQEKHK